LPFTGIGVDTLVVNAWGHHGHSPRRGEHVALVVIAVAHHQPPPVLVNLIGELLDIGGHLSVQRRRQHLPGTIANDLVEQRLGPTRRSVCVGRRPVMNYLEHGRTFPNQRANAGPDQSYGLSDHSREGAPTHAASPRTIHMF